MPKPPLILALLLSCGLLVGCVEGIKPSGSASLKAPGAVGAIEVTPLAPPVAATTTATAPAAKPAASPAAALADQPTAAAPAAGTAAVPGASGTVAKDEATDTPAATEAPPPVPAKSDAQIACEKKRGTFRKMGSSETYACIFQTRDGGQPCRKAGDCEGLCLARSMTCAPFKPIFGCQDILQEDGMMVTECVN